MDNALLILNTPRSNHICMTLLLDYIEMTLLLDHILMTLLLDHILKRETD